APRRNPPPRGGPRPAAGASRGPRARGRLAPAAALDALLAAAGDKSLMRRHAAVLFLGHVGGPKAAAKLKDVLEKDEARLVRAAAADGLEQIGTKDALAAAAAFRNADAG